MNIYGFRKYLCSREQNSIFQDGCGGYEPMSSYGIGSLTGCLNYDQQEVHLGPEIWDNHHFYYCGI